MLFLEEGKEAGRKKLPTNGIPQMEGLGRQEVWDSSDGGVRLEKQEAFKALARPFTEQDAMCSQQRQNGHTPLHWQLDDSPGRQARTALEDMNTTLGSGLFPMSGGQVGLSPWCTLGFVLPL